MLIINANVLIRYICHAKNNQTKKIHMFRKLLFTALAFTALNVSAQTADEIIAKYRSDGWRCKTCCTNFR